MHTSDITEEIRQEIIELYKNNYSRNQIKNILSDRYYFHIRTINKILTDAGLELVNCNTSERKMSRSKYGLNKEFFDNIDSPSKAYILGFLAADGCNLVNRNTIYIGLQERDKAILERMKKEMHSTFPLEKKKKKCTLHGPGHYSYHYCYKMFSKHMCERLIELNIREKKSYIVEFPPASELPHVLIRDYLRGYFDGDGCIYYSEPKNKCPQIEINITTASEKFAKQLVEFVDKELNLKSKYKLKPHSTTYVWVMKNRKDIAKFLDYIYKDSDIYLERKYQKYLCVTNYVYYGIKSAS